MTSRLPAWLRQEIPGKDILGRARFFCAHNVHTVCQEARCPNLGFCFDNHRFTFIILGNICTRNCSFCSVAKSSAGKLPLDIEEPRRIRDMAERLKLSYVVLTSVTRDDLLDGGAAQFAETIRLIHGLGELIKVEVLIPDFQGKQESLECVLEAVPEVAAHNLETVSRLYSALRPEADYCLSLELLRRIKYFNPSIITKSSLMLGLGELEAEVMKAMQDLRASGCDILTLGQYLAPSSKHYPVREFISPRRFKEYEGLGRELGFRAVLSAPLTRSSFQADRVYQECLCAT